MLPDYAWERARALVVLELEGERCAQVVLVSDEQDTVLLGVTTLEGLGYKVDPVTGKLEKIGVLLLVGVGGAFFNRFKSSTSI